MTDVARTPRTAGPVTGGGRVFGSVVALLGRGLTPRAAARALGISADLAEAVAAEAQRLGLTVAAGAACGTACGPDRGDAPSPAVSAACAGCPLAR